MFRTGAMMARAETASASVRSDSIKGMAQSIARPAYRRLVNLEPALRRAVPALIIAFLITISIGAMVEVMDHRRHALSEVIDNIGTVADLVAERLDRPAPSKSDCRSKNLQTQVHRFFTSAI